MLEIIFIKYVKVIAKPAVCIQKNIRKPTGFVVFNFGVNFYRILVVHM